MRDRKDVLVDLQPYVYTYFECALQEYVFQNQKERYRHEKFILESNLILLADRGAVVRGRLFPPTASFA
jgi:hypothetical protein